MTQLDVLSYLLEFIEGDDELWASSAEVADHCAGDHKEVARALLAAVRSRRSVRFWFREPSRGAACWGYRLNDRGIAYLDRYSDVDEYEGVPSEEADASWSSYAQPTTQPAPTYAPPAPTHAQPAPTHAQLPPDLPINPVGFGFPKAHWTRADAEAAAGRLETESPPEGRALESLGSYWRLMRRSPAMGTEVITRHVSLPDGRPVVVLDDRPGRETDDHARALDPLEAQDFRGPSGLAPSSERGGPDLEGHLRHLVEGTEQRAREAAERLSEREEGDRTREAQEQERRQRRMTRHERHLRVEEER